MKAKKGLKKKDKVGKEGLDKVNSKPLKSKQKRLKNKKKLKKGLEKVKDTEEVILLDPETVNVREEVPKVKEVPKIRRSATSENVEENYMLVPWASREEWNQVCLQFHQRNYKDVIARIAVWQKRVVSLPVGVEATLFLLEALIYDDKLLSVNGRNVHFTEDQARSLYSLAIIRYLNHVSQLASQSLGGPNKKLTRELAAIVDTPEWLVGLRNDVSHGPTAPSIEVLRMGGDFVLQWLKDKYWKLPDDVITSSVNSSDPFTILPSNSNDEVNVLANITELFAAYIAARIYKMRKQNTVTDPDVIRLVSSTLVPLKTKVAVMHLKNSLRQCYSSHPALFTEVLSQELIPNLEFYEDFKSIVRSSKETRDNAAFDKFYTLWMPIIKMMESKGKLISVLRNLTEVVVNPEFEKMWTLSARWIDKILERFENSGKKYSKHLVSILETVVKHPNQSMHHYIERLFRITEQRLGSDAIPKLKHLVTIFLEDLEEKKTFKRTEKRIKLFTLEDIDKVHLSAYLDREKGKHNIGDNNANHGAASFTWSLDGRSEDFWRNVPLGKVFDEPNS